MKSQDTFENLLISTLRNIKRNGLKVQQNNLMIGDSGTIFLLLFCKRHLVLDKKLKTDVTEMIIDGLNQCIDIVSSSVRINHIGDSEVSSLMFLLCYARKYQLLKGLGSLLEDLEQMTFNVFFHKLSAKNFDFFHGCSGDLIRLLLLDKIVHQNIFDYYLRMLIEHSKWDKIGIIWHSFDQNGAPFINLGLPHGLSGTLLLLLKLYQKGKLNNPKVIFDVANSLKKRQADGLKDGFFIPSTTNISGGDIKYSSLSWCYGDLVAAHAFFRLARLFRNHSYYNEGVKLISTALKREDWLANNPSPLSLCHGLPAIAYLFFKIFKVSGNEKCRQRSLYWFNRSIEYINVQYNSEDLFNENMYLKNSLMYGISGTAISLLSILRDTTYPEFDDLIML